MGFPDEGFGGFIIFAVVAIFAIVIIGIVYSAAKGISQWSHNNSQPVLKVPAQLIGKRSQVGVSHHHHDDHVHHSASTTYFATFELENGERMEFTVSGSESGLLMEGDRGELTYQGTRYHEFYRLLADGSPAPRPASDQPKVPAGELSGALCVRCEAPMLVGRHDCGACGWKQPA